MLVTNFRLKYLLTSAVAAAFQLFDVGYLSPLRARGVLALRATVRYVEQRMPLAVGFATQRQLLDYALRQISVAGACCEFGVYRGGTINFMAKRRKDLVFHGFDSFEGLPEDWQGFDMTAGAFGRNGRVPKVRSNVELVVGRFDDSLPSWKAKASEKVAFMHIDCDLYSSTVSILRELRERLQPGTIIVFDEYFNYPGFEHHELKAWHEFVADNGVDYSYLAYARQQVCIRIEKV